MYSPILKEAPEGYVPYHQWPEYGLAADSPTFFAPRMVGKDPVGLYRRLWPIVIEEYISDKEPVLADSDPEKISANRVILWQRVFREDIPQGWRRLSTRPQRTEGFAILDSDTYQTAWSESARRYARKWQHEFLDKEFSVERISKDEFIAAYKYSHIPSAVRSLYTEITTNKIAEGAHVRFLAARQIPTGTVAAALSLVESPRHTGSYYLCGFIQKKYEHTPAMVGLMDEWHRQSRAAGIRFLHFGQFWQKGDPKDWKGFSQFKSKFGLQYIEYPPTLLQFAKGRLF